MNFGTNKSLIEVIKKSHLKEHMLETFILTLIVNGTKIVGKNSIH